MIIIAAADNNNGIGNEGDLLFDIPEDKKFFKEKTENPPFLHLQRLHKE